VPATVRFNLYFHPLYEYLFQVLSFMEKKNSCIVICQCTSSIFFFSTVIYDMLENVGLEECKCCSYILLHIYAINVTNMINCRNTYLIPKRIMDLFLQLGNSRNNVLKITFSRHESVIGRCVLWQFSVGILLRNDNMPDGGNSTTFFAISAYCIYFDVPYHI
jgi:hypothetical protein